MSNQNQNLLSNSIHFENEVDTKELPKEFKIIPIFDQNNEMHKIVCNPRTTTTNDILNFLFGNSEEEVKKNEIYSTKLKINELEENEHIGIHFDAKILPKNQPIYKYYDRYLRIIEVSKKDVSIVISQNLHEPGEDIIMFPCNSSVAYVLKQICQDRNVSMDDYGLFIHYSPKKDLTDEIKQKQVTFLPLSEKSSDLKALNHLLRFTYGFGIWLEPGYKRTLLSYFFQTIFVNGYTWFTFQPKPSHFTLIYPEILSVSDMRTRYPLKEIELMIDLTIACDILVEQFCRFLELPKLRNNKPVSYSLLLVEFKKKKKKQDLYDKDNVEELTNLKSNLSLQSQGVKPHSYLKLVQVKHQVDTSSRNQTKTQKQKIKIQSSKVISIENDIWEELKNEKENIIWEENDENTNENEKMRKDNDFSFVYFMHQFERKQREKNKQNDKESDNEDDEEEDYPKIIEKIRAASLNKSIEILTNPSGFSPIFVELFVEVLPTIVDPIIFIQKLIQIFNVPDTKPNSEENYSDLEVFQIQKCVLKTFQFISETNSQTISQTAKSMILEFCQQIDYENADKEIITITDIIKEFIGRSLSSRKQKLNKLLLPPTKFNIFDLSDKEIAQRLSYSSQQLFFKIQNKELFDGAWTEKNREKQAPNVIQMIQRFNLISDWVSTKILKTNNLSKRAKLLSRIIQIAASLRSFQNFNDLMAFLGGIQNSAVHRLSKTWNKLPQQISQIYQELDDLTGAIGGSKKLREAFEDGAPPLVPFLGLYLSDLTIIEELANFLGNGLVNWAKKRRLFVTIKKIQYFQSFSYDFSYQTDIWDSLAKETIISSEDEQWRLSTKIEPFQK
ncbi:guanine nucleotide exchange factor [Anaeramoeba ignava]|uniref:Guanine nucleotide exchange factor n=1 Tax=Anaeramoeba ignava TaxID=1746090 RepID=A0A9Q0LU04_ANAIG|nr:guanine nucleotide exchange factor [Anaeramoeba ignava]